MDSEQIKKIIEESLRTSLVQVEDDSYRHRNHKQSQGKGGHYNAIVVSDDFTGMDLLARHRKIYDVLQMSNQKNIHALSIQAFTNEEWARRQK